MSETTSTETAVRAQPMSAAEHCAAAENEFTRAQQLYESGESDVEYRRRMEWASMHLRIAEVVTGGASLAIEYAVAKEGPAYRGVGHTDAGREAWAWTELLGRAR
ncbi:hypothetical protein [Amycolatopsis sp. NPDC059657]|uniref:hypothetical protein n=1 Tax=Amycolatopsis sp. NPDC059657 TaxID=3346899 RepID=UPI00366CE99C